MFVKRKGKCEGMLNKKIDYNRNVPIKANVSRIHKQPVHTHNDDLEIFVVLKGTVRAVVGYSNLLLKEGEIMIFNDREMHGVYETEGENLIITVHINIKYFKKYNEAAYGSFFLMAATYLNGLRYDKPVAELRDRLFDIAKAQMIQTSSDEKLETLGKELLNQLISDFQYFYYSSSGGRHFFNRYEGKNNQAQAARMRMLMYYLWENYNQKITLQEYADETHINMYYLSHIIKESTGLNFQELLNYTRVEESEMLLLETDKKISEIAFECGFSATRYYVKHFEKWFQVSPEEYREKHLKRLVIIEDEEILTGDAAIDVINEFSGQKRYLTTGKSYFYTDVLEINAGKSGKTRKKRFGQMVKWEENLYPEYGGLQEDLMRIKNAFKLCVPIASEKDFNNRTAAFLQESSFHSLLLKCDVTSNGMEGLGIMSDAFGRFCKSTALSTVTVHLAIKGNTKEKELFADNLIEEGRKASCKVTVKEVSQHLAGDDSCNYFFDSIYAVPWIIRGCLKNGYDQKTICSLFDEQNTHAHLITGNRGLITTSGIKKPSYFAYMCLSLLGDEIIENAESYIVTRKNQDIQILLYDYDIDVLGNIDDYSDWDKMKTLRFAAEKNKEYKLEISNLNGRYMVTQIRLGREICLFNKMVDMGMPGTITLEQEKAIRDFTKPALDFFVIDENNGTASLDVIVPKYGATLLQLHKAMDV